jgi:hypothetical protein
MAINVNKVYKSVLSILNKEERGYLTPYEFNNLARQAQLELLDSLFYQYNQFLNIENINRTNEGYADLAEKIQEQIDEHYKSATLTPSSGKVTVPTDAYRILDVTMRNHGLKVEKVDKVRLPFLKSSPLTKPSSTFPIYYQEATEVVFDPSITENVAVNYVAKPSDPRFGYTTNTQYGTEIYDANPFIDGGIILGTRNIGIVSTNQTDITTNQDYTVTVGTTSGVTTSSSAGTGAVIKLTASGNTITAVEVTSVGSGFLIGDTITISETAIPQTTAGNIVLTLRVQDMYANTNQGSTDFTLHESLETNLILSILGYAGLIIKDPSIVQGVTQLASADAMNKKQQ